MLNNNRTLSGGAGGFGLFAGGAGGAGVSNTGLIGTLNNNGTLSGGAGGFGGVFVGAHGTALYNSGTVGALNNSGTIGDGASAIYSTGSIGPITNGGQIIGNVEIDNQASVTVQGGTGKTFGSWTGGVITIGNGNLTFAGGNTALGDNIVVNGGTGTVYNNDPLMVAMPITITGSFDESGTGKLDLLLSSAGFGSLDVSGHGTFDGTLVLDFIDGFAPKEGETFDVIDDPDGATIDLAATDILGLERGFEYSTSFADGEFTVTALNNGVSASQVPEPGPVGLLGAGLLALWSWVRRRRDPEPNTSPPRHRD
jgi:hypothetical protein